MYGYLKANRKRKKRAGSMQPAWPRPRSVWIAVVWVMLFFILIAMGLVLHPVYSDIPAGFPPR